VCFGVAVRRGEDVSEIEQGVGVLVEQVVCAARAAAEFASSTALGVVATLSVNPDRQSLADDLGVQVLARTGFLTLARQQQRQFQSQYICYHQSQPTN